MKTNKLLIALFCLTSFLFQFVAKSQISTDELPTSFNFDGKMSETNSRNIKTMPQIDLEKLRIEDEKDEKNGIPPRFGFPHKVDFNLENSGEWFDLPNGDKLWKLEIYCPTALSINLTYDKFWLPEGAKFFIYSSDKKHHIGAFTSNNNFGSKEDLRGFATGLIYGDRITLEYYLPKDVSEQGIISIAKIVQGYRFINVYGNSDDIKKGEDVFQIGFGSSNSNQVNINCPEGSNWQKEKNAIALILVGGYRGGTGALINNTAGDYRPLFLMAAHSIFLSGNFDAMGVSNLDQWSFCWHYELPPNPNNCNYINQNPSPPPLLSTSGAKLLANSSNSSNSFTDFALLELKENPALKSGVTPYYLGWDRTGSIPNSGVGIHHPQGDVKKIATFNTSPTTSWNYWEISWAITTNGHSITEGGSSGSPLLNSLGRVIGQLYGSFGIAGGGGGSRYGKFNASWDGLDFYSGQAAIHPQRRLRDWLHPFITQAPNTLNGIEYNCPLTVIQGVQSTRRVTCEKINVQNNANVPNNVKLELNAKEVNIYELEVQAGAEFEIWINP